VFDSVPSPVELVRAFKELGAFSQAAFWVFVVAVAAKIGGGDIARIIKAIRGKE
jgi:hypothetical protein